LGISGLEDLRFVQLELPFDPRAHRDVMDDTVRDRFGSSAVSRARLLHHNPSIQMPTLPD